MTNVIVEPIVVIHTVGTILIILCLISAVFLFIMTVCEIYKNE